MTECCKTKTDGDSFFKLLSKKTQMRHFKTFYKYLSDTGRGLGQEQPFYTIDIADILWKVKLWRENFPNVNPYYAVKANADPVILRLFVILGYGFDCSTEGEIRLVMKAGADPKKIIFAHTVKIPSALHYASSIGCDLLTFDSKEELLKIQNHFSTARLILRVKSPSQQTVYNLSTKYGCEVEAAEELLLNAKQLKLNVVGVSFHVGALCDDPKVFTSTIQNCRLVFETAKHSGYHLTIMDIGAGFFGSKEREEFFYELSRKINYSLEENFPGNNTEFIAEPGCYYVCSAITLTTAIIGKKTTSKKEQNKAIVLKEYYINDGLYGSFFKHQELYDIKPKPLMNASEIDERRVYQSKVWGQTCCAEDMVLEKCSLPEMDEAEFIVWENMGAYRRNRCSTFTEVSLPETRYVFIRNSRLNLDWITDIEDLAQFIMEVADLVEINCFSD